MKRTLFLPILLLISLTMNLSIFASEPNRSIICVYFANTAGKTDQYAELITKASASRLIKDDSLSTIYQRRPLLFSTITNQSQDEFATICDENNSRYLVTGTYTIDAIPGSVTISALLYDNQKKEFTTIPSFTSETGALLAPDCEMLSTTIRSLLDDTGNSMYKSTDYTKFIGFNMGVQNSYTKFLSTWGESYDNVMALSPYLGYEFSSSVNKPFLNIKIDALFFDSTNNKEDDASTSISYTKKYRFFEGYGGSIDLFSQFSESMRIGLTAGAGYCQVVTKTEKSSEDGPPSNPRSESQSGYTKAGIFVEAIPSSFKLNMGVSYLHSFGVSGVAALLVSIGAGIRF